MTSDRNPGAGSDAEPARAMRSTVEASSVARGPALARGPDYERQRGLIESALFGESVAPLRIGRFSVLERVGSGGMGVVYAAYDDVLDRKVAVKVLRGTDDERGRERMLREARAMARLTHTNIVGVHEVGEHERQVFLAMEFVRGQSLDRWIEPGDGPRPWAEVVDVFRRAGEGLAAAHAAGLVHRDFKPHNVMLAEDGSVKVLDFGLAFAVAAAPTEVSSDDDVMLGRSGDDVLTRTGALVGTPAYMSPEQLAARPVTAASDQFSFCVSLYEGLYGQRPFAGARLEQLAASVIEGTIREPPPGIVVPGWIRAICRRGLAVDPAHRFASLRALLDAMDRDPAVIRRRWLGVAAVTTVAVAGSFGLAALQRDDETVPCEQVAAALEPTWGHGQQAAARDGLLGSGVPFARDTWSRLEPRLSSYAQTWIDASTEACQAHAQGRQSAAIFDLRTVCLESRRAGLDALVGLLVHADAEVAERAATMVANLPAVARCGDLEALTAAVPPPEDPAQAQQVAQLRGQLARARVHDDAGRYDEALRLATEVQQQAETLAYDPLTAEVALALGSTWQEAMQPAKSVEALTRALWTAEGSGHHQVAIEALSRRLFVRAELLGEAVASRNDESHMRALLRRDPGDGHLRWLVANNLAVVHDNEGQRGAAVERYEEALGHAQARGVEGHLDASVVLANLASMAMDDGRLDDAYTRSRAALALAEGVLGPEHPRLPLYLYPLGHALMARGQHGQARAQFERSVAIYEQAGDDPSPDVAQDLYMLAELARSRRDFARASELAQRGATIVRARLGEDHVLSVRLAHAVGHAAIGLGQGEAGLAHHRRGLRLSTQHHGPAHVLASQAELAVALLDLGYPDQAVAELDVAHATLVSLEAQTSTEMAVVLQHRGEARRRLGRLEGAAADLQAARAIHEDAPGGLGSLAVPILHRLAAVHRDRVAMGAAIEVLLRAEALSSAEHDADDPELAAIRFDLAQALLACAADPAIRGCGDAAGADPRGRAVALARAAHAGWQSLGSVFDVEAQAVDAWLATLVDPSTSAP